MRDIWSQMKKHLPDERLVFVDLETGGAEPWRPIFEIAAIAVDTDLNELETFEARLRFCRHSTVGLSLNLPSFYRRHFLHFR